jgi:uncharacterized protein YndB with AHSA1/START domain
MTVDHGDHREGDDLGVLDAAGDRWSVTFTRRLHHPVEEVWRAVTEPEQLAAWFPDRIVGELGPGARLRFVFGDDDADGFDGEVLVYDPPTLLELSWGGDRLRIELHPDGEGTVLTLVDTFAELGKAARDAAGWHECLDRLECRLEGAVPPAPGATWRETNARYVERFGPPASTIGPPEGWQPPAEAAS